jgi:putative ABC transport system substrate-binding protein
MREGPMRRREAIILLGSAAAWPLAARAQQSARMRRIGVLTGFPQSDLVGQSLLSALKEQLETLGWTEDRNIQFEIRWGSTDPERLRANGAELVRMMPDAIVVHGSQALTAVRRESNRIPIIFASVADPIASGYVKSLARPGGNVTGFTIYGGMPSPKLLERLKEFAPETARVAFVITPANLGMARQLEALESAAPSFAVKVIAMLIRDPAEIGTTVSAFAQQPNGGLVVSSDVFMITHRDLVIEAAARHRMPAVYQDRSFVTAGGLMSYSVDRREQYRRVATYVDRILNGAKPGDLPIQQPVKFEFVLNLKTARTLGLDVTPTLIARADEVIE